MLAQWDAPPPKPGEFLLTERGRIAKRIIEVRRYEGIQQWGGRPYDYTFIYESTPLDELPFGAVVHSFFYHPRHSRHRFQ
jgi:hypothetical protein